MEPDEKFDESLIKAIDEQLKQVFGETATSVIYNYLQTALSLPRKEIPRRLETFIEGLDKFLSSGARVVEKVILEDLYSDFGHEFKTKEGFRFPDYVKELKMAIGSRQVHSCKAQ